jgi:hypothetical protein
MLTFTAGKKDGPHYQMEVNKGSIRMQTFESIANQRIANGYRIGHIFEQDGNAIVVWERFRYE